MNVRNLLPLLVCLACTPTGMGHLSVPPQSEAAPAAWEALAGGPGCQSLRSTAERYRGRYPALATHATGAWLLCSLSVGDRAAVAATLAQMPEISSYPDWFLVAAWARWIDGQAALPDAMPRIGKDIVIRRAIERTMAMPLTNAAEVFVRWPDWDWPELFEREVVSMLSARDALDAVERLIDRGRRPKAWALLEHFWEQKELTDQAALSHPEAWCGCAEQTIFMLAKLAFDLREYALAAIAAQRAATGPQPGPAVLLHGRALARQRRGDEAVQYWRRELPRVPDADSRAAILYRLGLLAEDRGNATEAIAWYRKAATIRTPIRDRDHAGFRAGWLKWVAGEPQAAARFWEADLERAMDPVARRRLLYWLGRTAPESDWHAALLREAPLSWYAWLAVGRDETALLRRVQWYDSTPAAVTLAAQRLLGSTRLAMDLGWLWPARFEFEAALTRATDPEVRLELLGQAERLDLSSTALKLFWDAFGESFRKDPPNFDRRLWRIVYPRPFAHTVTRAARAQRIDPALIYAVMREESHFQPEIISPAGAVGLLQLMPATATRLAQTLGLPAPSLEDLFAPEVNVTLGAAYLRQLLDRFAGDETLAIASYNAGPAAVDRWRQRVSAAEIDRFVEEIPYTETRRYVIKVTRSLIRYRALMALES